MAASPPSTDNGEAVKDKAGYENLGELAGEQSFEAAGAVEATVEPTGTPVETPSASSNGTKVESEPKAEHEDKDAGKQTLPSRVASLSLSSATDGLILYDLTSEAGGTALFSPHTVKTILDLRLLDIGYDRQRLTFTQIRTDLAARVAENVTVPTVELSDGTHLFDSWQIAEYLEASHPSGSKVFGGTTSGKRFAAFVNQFGKSVLSQSLGPLAIPGIAAVLRGDELAYFERKIGPERYQRLSNLSKDERDAHAAAAIHHLNVVEAALTAERSASDDKRKPGNWLLAGPDPTHADFVLFGWYVYTRGAGRARTKEIWESSPALARWKNAMLAWCGPIADDFIHA